MGRRVLRCLGYALLATLAPFLVSAAGAPERGQGRLEARYTASLAGIPIGTGTWVVDVGENHYTAAASGTTTGLIKVFTGGQGTSAAHGTLTAGRPASSVYAATISTLRRTDEVRLTIHGGNVKNFDVDPPADKDPERVPITEAHQRGVQDPMTASLVWMPGSGDLLSPEACQRTLPVFDGRLRYDLRLSYKRMDKVKAEKGYSGPVVVCSVYFSPIAGFVPSRSAVKYLTKLRDIEVWLAPIAGTRVLAPFRAQGPTPIGLAVLEADEFVTVAGPTRASAGRPKIR